MSEAITLETVRGAFFLCQLEDPGLSIDDALEAAWIARGIEVEKLTADLATEHAQRLAAEAREAELRTALEPYADDRNWSEIDVSEAGEDSERKYYWSRGGDDEPWMIAEDALTAPSSLAGDVLAVSIEVDDAYASADLTRIYELSAKWLDSVRA